jgi:HK97 gp10 family phage protein
MSLQISVNLPNLEALAEALDNVSQGLGSAVTTALMNVGNTMLMTAQTIVPVRTGYLKSTLALQQISQFQIRLIAAAPYAAYVEFGTRRMAPRLFLTRSIQAHIPDFTGAVQTEINNLVSQYLSVAL